MNTEEADRNIIDPLEDGPDRGTGLDESTLRRLIADGEGRTIEFKREWYPDDRRGKGEFAKDVLALANSISEGEYGFLLYGVGDDRRVVGVDPEAIPSSEAISQILSTYTTPVPLVSTSVDKIDELHVLVVAVSWSKYQPHHATRDVDGVIRRDVYYCRRHNTVGRLELNELEQLIRAKDRRLAPPPRSEPISAGLVETPRTAGGRCVFRIGNTSDQPVDSIDAVVDIRHAHLRALYRQSLTNNLKLYPGESREFEFSLHHASFSDSAGTPLETRGKIWHWWLDIEVKVTYRGADGLIHQLLRAISYGG